jgi:hypothetical protein
LESQISSSHSRPNLKITEGAQSGIDRVDLITRAFNLELQSLLQELKDGIFGTLKTLMRTIEFQKCDLPHRNVLTGVTKSIM